jgi:hypothetical protein
MGFDNILYFGSDRVCYWNSNHVKNMSSMIKSKELSMNEPTQELYDYLAAKYKLHTDRDLSLLEMYCGAVINMREAQKCIDELGVVVEDRYGTPKQNPANDVLIKNKLQAMRALEKLRLNEMAEDGVLKDFM